VIDALVLLKCSVPCSYSACTRTAIPFLVELPERNSTAYELSNDHILL